MLLKAGLQGLAAQAGKVGKRVLILLKIAIADYELIPGVPGSKKRIRHFAVEPQLALGNLLAQLRLFWNARVNGLGQIGITLSTSSRTSTLCGAVFELFVAAAHGVLHISLQSRQSRVFRIRLGHRGNQTRAGWQRFCSNCQSSFTNG